MNDLTARAKKGVHILEQAIIELLKQHLDGLTNYAIAKILEIDSDQEGRQKNCLSWSLLGRLMKQSLVTRTKNADGKHVLYRATSEPEALRARYLRFARLSGRRGGPAARVR